MFSGWFEVQNHIFGVLFGIRKKMTGRVLLNGLSRYGTVICGGLK